MRFFVSLQRLVCLAGGVGFFVGGVCLQNKPSNGRRVQQLIIPDVPHPAKVGWLHDRLLSSLAAASTWEGPDLRRLIISALPPTAGKRSHRPGLACSTASQGPRA